MRSINQYIEIMTKFGFEAAIAQAQADGAKAETRRSGGRADSEESLEAARTAWGISNGAGGNPGNQKNPHCVGFGIVDLTYK